MKVMITVSEPRAEGDPEARYGRWDQVASFEATADADVAWEVYRQAVAALTPEARKDTA